MVALPYCIVNFLTYCWVIRVQVAISMRWAMRWQQRISLVGRPSRPGPAFLRCSRHIAVIVRRLASVDLSFLLVVVIFLRSPQRYHAFACSSSPSRKLSVLAVAGE